MIEKKRFSEVYFECIILYYKKGENPPKYDKMTHK